MNKVQSIMVISILSLITIKATWSSFPLQDGYRLQGWIGSNGQIYKGYFDKVIDDEVMGAQGSPTHYIFGWVSSDKTNNYFILNTNTHTIEWLNSDSYFNKLAEYGCPSSDMNKEINLAGFRNNQLYHKN